MIDAGTLRIIDANLNRAAEALRVMEDFARFVLNDPSMTEAAKGARHELRHLKFTASPDELLLRRDTPADVGTEIKTSAELVRRSSMEVILAAGKRLGEALRVIEEFGKTIDPEVASRVERIRYLAYDLEKRLSQAARARSRFGMLRLYVLLTESFCHGPWFATAQAALEGGADCLQLREGSLSDRELLQRARQLAALCRDRNALLIVNNRPDIAQLSGAHGVHVGQDDMAVSEARRILSPDSLVGVSSHSFEQAQSALASAPDYVAVGPMFASATKPQDHIAGPVTLSRVAAQTSLPLVAIGGISEKNVNEVLSAAQCCVAVCGAVIAQSDVAEAVRRLRHMIDSAFANLSPIADR